MITSAPKSERIVAAAGPAIQLATSLGRSVPEELQLTVAAAIRVYTSG